MIYRYPQDGIILGVCSGIARSTSIEPWVVRLIAILFSLMGGFLIILALYIAGGLLMDKAPITQFESDDIFGAHATSNQSQQSTNQTQQTLAELRQQVRGLHSRVEQLEKYMAKKP